MPLGFESGVWLWVAAAAFALGHLAVLAYFVRGSGSPSQTPARSPPDAPTDATPESVGGGSRDSGGSGELPPVDSDRVVQCPHCGVENAAAFRFCRFCVGELAGATTIADASGASRDGQTF